MFQTSDVFFFSYKFLIQEEVKQHLYIVIHPFSALKSENFNVSIARLIWRLKHFFQTTYLSQEYLISLSDN